MEEGTSYPLPPSPPYLLIFLSHGYVCVRMQLLQRGEMRVERRDGLETCRFSHFFSPLLRPCIGFHSRRVMIKFEEEEKKKRKKRGFIGAKPGNRESHSLETENGCRQVCIYGGQERFWW